MSTEPPVIVITGASRGIGAATALRAASAGWSVAVNFHSNRSAADDVVASCILAGSKAVAIRADVSHEPDVVNMFDEATRQLGPVRSLVNNAAILSTMTRVEDLTAERIRRLLDVNVTGAFLCAREAVRSMSTDFGGAGGTIVNVSSAASFLGSPNEYVDYAATKGAVDTLTIGLAKEVADRGIRVNAVRPGLIDTEIHATAGMPDRVERLKENIPMGRGGTADEVAALIMYLAGSDSGYVTGSLVNIAGGR